MEDLAAFSVREVKRAAAEERERDEYGIRLQKDSESQSKRQSHPSKLSKNWRMGDVCWAKRPEKEEWLVELVGDQNPGAKIGRERREQRKC